MAITSARRIPFAQEFVRLGFGDTIDDSAPFYSRAFLTQELTTTEVQAVLPIVTQYNAFDGARVAAGIEQFRGRVSGWKFGSAGSPLLVAVLAPWSHQVEELRPGGKSGTMFTPEELAALVAQMQHVFLAELGADKFDREAGSEYAYGAWWD